MHRKLIPYDRSATSLRLIIIFQQPAEKVHFPGCSKMAGCKAPEIPSREAYFWVR
jgi:hypothetical protein